MKRIILLTACAAAVAAANCGDFTEYSDPKVPDTIIQPPVEEKLAAITGICETINAMAADNLDVADTDLTDNTDSSAITYKEGSSIGVADITVHDPVSDTDVDFNQRKGLLRMSIDAYERVDVPYYYSDQGTETADKIVLSSDDALTSVDFKIDPDGEIVDSTGLYNGKYLVEVTAGGSTKEYKVELTDFFYAFTTSYTVDAGGTGVSQVYTKNMSGTATVDGQDYQFTTGGIIASE